MPDKRNTRIDQQLVKALSHPVRVEILEALRDRVASPNELSREMDSSVGTISYHAKTLVKCGCLELVHTKPRRGAMEHFFSVPPRSSVSTQHQPANPATDSGISSTAIEVDEIGWKEIAEILDNASRLVAEACTRSSERLAGAEGISIVVGLAAFEARKRRSPDEQRD